MQTYDDAEFLEVIDQPTTAEWIGSAPICHMVACTMKTTNQRLIAIAADTDIQIYDPAADGGDGAIVPADTFDTTPGRALAFRRKPDNPEAAPETPETGYWTVKSALRLRVGLPPASGEESSASNGAVDGASDGGPRDP